MIRRMLTIVAAAFLLIGVRPDAQAGNRTPYTTKVLVEFCRSYLKYPDQKVSSEEKQEANFCAGYFEGFEQLHSMLSVKKIQPLYCVPDGTQRIEEVRKVIAVLEKDPDLMNTDLPSAFAVSAGFIEAFPCDQKAKK